MYSTEQIATGIRNPDIALRELNRLYFRRLYTREFNENGTDIFAEDWDNLIILDACTPTFSRQNTRSLGGLSADSPGARAQSSFCGATLTTANSTTSST